MLNIDNYLDENGLFDGRYKLIRLLDNEGGSADVWLAEDMLTAEAEQNDSNDEHEEVAGTGVMVAIKIYRPKNILDMDGERNFKKEFKIVYNCHHANLLTPTGYNASHKEMPYLVMPFCHKGSTEKLVGKLTDKDEIWRFLQDVASGLVYLHSLNPPIVHQDIKPANILIDDNDFYCITDFGISVHRDKDADRDDAHSSGTTLYMAPERFTQGSVPQAQSDIWSLGATLYELITGDVPFGDDGGMVQNKNTKIPRIKTRIPKEIKQIVYACLNFDPASRPTANQLIDFAKRKGKTMITKDSLSTSFIVFVIVMACVTGITIALQIFKHKHDSLARFEQNLTSEQKLNILEDHLFNDNTDNINLTLDSIRLLAEKEKSLHAQHEYLKLRSDWCDMADTPKYKNSAKLHNLQYIRSWQEIRGKLTEVTDNEPFERFVFQYKDSTFVRPEELILLALIIKERFNYYEQPVTDSLRIDSIAACLNAIDRDKRLMSKNPDQCLQCIASIREQLEIKVQ